jgi:hypothetical protein
MKINALAFASAAAALFFVYKWAGDRGRAEGYARGFADRINEAKGWAEGRYQPDQKVSLK